MEDAYPAEVPEWWDTLTRVALAAVPVVGGPAQVIYQDVRARLAARAAQTMDEIVGETGLRLLRERVNSNPELEAILAQGVDAAMRTGYEAKRRAQGHLGRRPR